MNFWSCRETSLLIARGEYEESSGSAKAFAWLHLLYCRYCRRFLRQLEMLGRAARLRADRSAVPARREGFEQELIAKLTGLP